MFKKSLLNISRFKKKNTNEYNILLTSYLNISGVFLDVS